MKLGAWSYAGREGLAAAAASAMSHDKGLSKSRDEGHSKATVKAMHGNSYDEVCVKSYG